jgi:hypothetical protein
MLCRRKVDVYMKPLLSELLQMRQLARCSDVKPVDGHSLFRERFFPPLVSVKPIRHNWQRNGKMQMTSVVPNIVTPASFGQQDQARYNQ